MSRPLGCSFEFDAVNKVLRYVWENQLTDEVLLNGDAAGRRLLASLPPCRGILDFSNVATFDVSSAIIRNIARKPPAFGVGQAVVLVAPRDVIYGMSRMFVMLGEQTRPNVSVVRSMAEAYHLLGLAQPQFEPVAP